ncbi:uncharacterized protein [Ptychodera flava]|uniref:uncharacterized protein isoform X2 n=1 Tax=Ptychodera flava TaxID=63121 RepID=UPI00396A759F
MFLSLPVFSQRLIYRYSSQSFELDPPLKRSQYELDKIRLMAWVRTQRAPLFFKTSMFIEFLLCKNLLKTKLHLTTSSHDICYSSIKFKRDEQLLIKCIGKVSGMRRFRSFLSSTVGSKVYQFWLDAEEFRRLPRFDTEKHRTMFRQIQSKYFRSGAALELPENAKWVAFSDTGDSPGQNVLERLSVRREGAPQHRRQRRGSIVGTGVEFTGRLRAASIYGDDRISIFTNNVFVPMQKFLMQTLRTYWLPRFVIHCKLIWHRRECNFDLLIQPSTESETEITMISMLDDMTDAIKRTKEHLLDKKKHSNLMSMFRSPDLRGPLGLIEEAEEFEELSAGSLSSSEDEETSKAEQEQEVKEIGTPDKEDRESRLGFALPTLAEGLEEEEEGHEGEEKKEGEADTTEDGETAKTAEAGGEEGEAAAQGEEPKEDEAAIKERLLEKYRRRSGKGHGHLPTAGSSKDSLSSLGASDSYYMVSISGKIRRKTTQLKKKKKVLAGEGGNYQKYIFDFETLTLMRRDEFERVQAERKRLEKEKKKEEKRLAKLAAQEAAEAAGKFKGIAKKGSKSSDDDKDKKPSHHGKGGRRHAIFGGSRRGNLPPLFGGRRGSVFSKRGPLTAQQKRRGSGIPSLPAIQGKRRHSLVAPTYGKASPMKLTKTSLQIIDNAERLGYKSTKFKDHDVRRKSAISHRTDESHEDHHVDTHDEHHEMTFEEQTHEDDDVLSHLPDICLSDLVLEEHHDDVVTSRASSATDEEKEEKLFESTSQEKLHTAAPVSKLCYIDFHLGESNYKYTHRGLVGGIESDRLAGSPFLAYLEKTRQFDDVNYLLFWNKAREYLTTSQYHSDMTGRSLKYRRAKEITATHLMAGGKNFVNIGEQLTHKLIEFLAEGLGDQLLVHAQELACETRRKKVLEHEATAEDVGRIRDTGFPQSLPDVAEENALIRNKFSKYEPKTRKKKKTILPSAKTLREETDDGTQEASRLHAEEAPPNVIAPHRMWRALQLAEGISQLCTEKEEMSDLSDLNSESDDEGSLKKKKQVIVRRRKPQEMSRQMSRIDRPPTAGGAYGISRHSMSHIRLRDPASGDQPFLFKSTIRRNGRPIKRPPKPRNFNDLLRNTDQFEYFKRFLLREKAETPLYFWQSVESMKQCKDAKSRQQKAIQIGRRYFSKAAGSGEALRCNAEVIKEIPKLTKVTPPMLLSAQACVVKSMEEQWFGKYLEAFPEDHAEDGEKQDDEGQAGIRFCRDKTKALWAMFIQNVVSFRRGLMNPTSLLLFKQFLSAEIAKDIEKQKVTGHSGKKVISNKIVSVEKLECDLAFWAEVERFKECADEVARSAASGTFSGDDEILVQNKAEAIINCFLDSQIPPKVQINVSQETVDSILDAFRNGVLERGLFHDAAVSIFTVLLHFWKKFNRERFAPKDNKKLPVTKSSKAEITRKKSKKIPNYLEINRKKPYKIVVGSIDEEPRIAFTLSHGLRMVMPPTIPKEDEIRQARRPMLLYNYHQHGRRYSRFVDERGRRFSKLAIDPRRMRLGQQSGEIATSSQPPITEDRGAVRESRDTIESSSSAGSV